MGKIWLWIGGLSEMLISGIKGSAGIIFGKVLGFFGLTLLSFSVLLPRLKAFVLQFVSGLPAEALDFLGAIGIGQAMSMVFSALVIRLSMKVLIVPKAAADALGGNP